MTVGLKWPRHLGQRSRTKGAPVTTWLGPQPAGTRTPHQTSQNRPQVQLTLTSSREHAPGPSPLPASLTHPHCFPAILIQRRWETPVAAFFLSNTSARTQAHTDRCTRMHTRDSGNAYVIRPQGLESVSDSGASDHLPGQVIPAKGSMESGNMNRNFFRNSESENRVAERYL